jgi:hypothetical protein
MPRLILAKCPNCGAGLRLDPEREIVTCAHCNASSFVQTDRRRATPEQPGFVIDVKPGDWNVILLLCVLGPLVVGGMGALAWAGIAAWKGTQAQSTGPVSEVAATPEPSFRWPATLDPPPSANIAPLVPLAAAGRGDARIAVGTCEVSGRLPKEVVVRLVRQASGRLACYEAGPAGTPGLRGSVTVRFVIGRDGAVSNAALANDAVHERRVTECVLSTFSHLAFPAPEAGIVTATCSVGVSVERVP